MTESAFTEIPQPAWLTQASPQDLSAEIIDEGAPKRWPVLLAHLCNCIDKTLYKHIPDDLARWEVCQRIVAEWATDHGGKEVYVPKADVLRRQLRDHRIWVLSADRGWSTQRLAQEFGVTVRAIEVVLAAQRAIRIPRVQGQLFAA